MNKHDDLFSALAAYAETGTLPMHMPGHKRNRALLGDDLPWAQDITEIDGFDDLHRPQGILCDSMRRASALWGSLDAYYLVGGGTSGILAGIYACVKTGDTVLAAANCHYSVFHALEICGADVALIAPDPLPGIPFSGGVTPGALAAAWERAPDAALAVLTSPTYEGVIGDIKTAAEFLHSKGIPLLVDEAHGAHLGLIPGQPPGSIACGADLVVHSLHKTLPSFTQTAILHRCSDRISPQRIRHALDVLQTSSPSYLLLASIDRCVGILERQRESLFGAWYAQIARFREKSVALSVLSLYSGAGAFAYDDGKLLLRAPCAGISMMNLLRHRFGIETELEAGDWVLAMTSCCDDTAAWRRLWSAVEAIDGSLRNRQLDRGVPMLRYPVAETVFSIKKALSAPSRLLPLSRCAGHIAGEYVWRYPPGQAILLPGQYITSDWVAAAQEDPEPAIWRTTARHNTGQLLVLADTADMPEQ